MTCARCEQLEEEVRQLRDRLYNHSWEPPRELLLTIAEGQILACLVGRQGVVSKHSLFEALYSTHPYADEPDIKIIDVFVSKIRTKIARFGLRIETTWGRGWELTPESRQRLLNWNAEAAA